MRILVCDHHQLSSMAAETPRARPKMARWSRFIGGRGSMERIVSNWARPGVIRVG
jgi:hypothetical protein